MESGKQQGKTDEHQVYVDRIEPAASSFTTENVRLKISGNLPSPAYKFDRFDIRINGSIIEVTPLATLDKSAMAAQVLVPFEQICEVDNLKPGRYEIKVYGRGGSLISGTTIQVEQE